MTLRPLALIAFAWWLAATPATAAESYDNCTGFIDALPAVVSTQGTWCLRKDVSTAMASGTAISIQANNVTLDCNGFKLGGLAAGLDTGANGIGWINRNNITVRNCSIRGFEYGLNANGGGDAYHAIENNRFDGNTHVGIHLAGDNHRVVGNQLNDTGGSPGWAGSFGMSITGDHVVVQGNTIAGVWVSDTANNGNGSAYGIVAVTGRGNVFQDNHILALIPRGTGSARALAVAHALVQGNVVLNAAGGGTTAVDGSNDGAPPSLCIGNRISGYTTTLDTCTSGGGNLTF